MRAHLLFAGGWADCAERHCKLPFHLDASAVEAAALPQVMLYQLFEAIDPPTLARKGWKLWNNRVGYGHRDYGLPAQISDSGDLIWMQNGLRTRTELVDGAR